MKIIDFRILRLVDRSDYPALAVLGVVTIALTVLESGGIALVFSLFRVVVDPSVIDQVRALDQLRGLVAGGSTTVLLLFLSIALFFLFVTKVFLQLATTWLRLSVEWRIRDRLSRQLLKAHLHGPYRLHLERNHSETVFTLTTGVGAVAIAVVGLMDLLSDSLLVLGIGAVLLYIQPLLTIIAILLLGGVCGIYLVLGRQYFIRWGRTAKLASTEMYRAVAEPLGGLKQIKILGVEPFFVSRFDSHMATASVLNRRNQFAGLSLRPLLELLIVTGLLAPIVLMLLRGSPAAEAVPFLALFGAAAYRLLPAIVRMTSTLQNQHFSKDAITGVHDDLEVLRAVLIEADQPKLARPPFRHEIRLNRIRFLYDDRKMPALNDLSMVIKRGQSVGFVGRSGSGKTTLIDVILGLLEPSGGEILIDGQPMAASARSQLFGYVPQDSFLVDDTVRNNVALGIPQSDIEEAKILWAIQAASLVEVVAELPNGLETMVGDRGIRLSGGQRQRIAIARALYHDPEILAFDESTSALDATTEAEVANAIHKLHGAKTLIIIAHRLSTVKECDQLYFFDEGRIVDSGSFVELIARNSSFRAMVHEMELGNASAQPLSSVG